jgi:hypothetical protein
MLFDFQGSNENVILLYVATDRGELPRVAYSSTIDLDIASDLQVSSVSKRQRIQQGSFASSTRSHYGQNFTRISNSLNLNIR